MTDEEKKKLLDVIQTNYFHYPKESKIYPFTDEFLKKYYINLDNKNILTSLGSGDQVFNAILAGAKEIDAFDNNMYAFYYFKLKEAFIKYLSFDEYIDNRYGNKKTYMKVRDTLKNETKNFFDYIFLELLNDHEYLLNLSLFHELNINIMDNLDKFNNYMNEESFNILKNKLNDTNINMYLSHVFGITSLDKKYDRIFLSNLSNYLDSMNKFMKTVNKLYNNNLNEDGIIYLGYSYDGDKHEKSEFVNSPSKVKIKKLKTKGFGKDKVFYIKKK